jgi:iron(III) transport system ATP-binding protein
MLRVEALSKSFVQPGGSVTVVDNVTFSVGAGQCFALLGPSGCGKTTTLRSVAGLETPDSGRITIGDSCVFDAERGLSVPVNERPIGMVFQSYAIWPHMTVFDNVAYPLTVGRDKPTKADARTRTLEALALVGMLDTAERSATQLSGGQQQRVALARAIVRRPQLLLLDEPLSNLDARLRETMRHELAEMILRIGVTALFVTHDQAEAFALADRLAVMNEGRLVQEGTPREAYGRPNSAFAATFLGGANVLSVDMTVGDGEQSTAVISGTQHRLTLADAAAKSGQYQVVIRPEDIEVSITAPTSHENAAEGIVRRVTFFGAAQEVLVDIGAKKPINAFVPRTASIADGAKVWLRMPADRIVVLDN